VFKDITVTSANLLLGDIQITIGEHHKILLERKTTDDLLASIKDGRYDEQSHRLQTMRNDHKIYYIIEGKIKSQHQTVFSSILSLNYFKGYSVLRTDDVKDTANMILYFTLKLMKEINKLPFKDNHEIVNNNDYAALIQKKKNDNITIDNFAQIVLCQIPLVSTVSAKAILSHFQNDLNTLINAIKADRTCLDAIKTDKDRKISKACISNIVAYLNPQKVS
jgi:ERCC4-type nuclease